MDSITVEVAHVRSGKMVNRFFDMCETTRATTDAIYTATKEKIF